MKVWIKVLSGFLLIVICLLLMTSSSYSVAYDVMINKQEIDTWDNHLRTVQELHTDLNEEFSLAMMYLGLENGTMADRALDRYSSKSAENYLNVDQLNDTLSSDDDHSARVKRIRISHQNMTDAFEDCLNTGSDALARKTALDEMKVAFDNVNNDLIALDSEIKKQLDELSKTSESLSDCMMVVVVIGVMSTVIVAVFLGVILSRHMVNRIRDITDAAGRIRKGDLSVAADESGNDEISDLSKAFNQMMLTVRLVAGDLGMADGSKVEGKERKKSGKKK